MSAAIDVSPSRADLKLIDGELLRTKSGYFRAVCNDTWSESKECVITPHEGNPWFVARLLQFIYYGWFQLGVKGVRVTEYRMVLSELVKAHKPEEMEVKNARTVREIKIMMLELAEYFDVPSLRQSCGEDLITLLQQQYTSIAIRVTDFSSSILQFMQDFCEVYDHLRAYFKESEGLDKLETALADLLMRRKIDVILSRPYNEAHFNIIATQSPYDDNEEDLRPLADKIRTYVESDSSFACKLAANLKAHYDKACRSLPRAKMSLQHLLV